MKRKAGVAALGATMMLGGCETTDWNTVGSILSLYSNISYISGDCPFGLHKTYDREGRHYCLGEPGTHVDRYGSRDHNDGGRRPHDSDNGDAESASN